MSNSVPNEDLECAVGAEETNMPAGRLSVSEIARRLNIGRMAVYVMLEQGLLPGIRVGRRWLITRQAYQRWERNCGTTHGAGLPPTTEVTVN